MAPPIRDLKCQKFGELTVLTSAGRGNNGGVLWLCQCTCGKFTRVAGSDLTRRGKNDSILSCGCRAAEAGKKNATHGQSKTAEFYVWTSLLDRCHNPASAAYKDYGGRGISVCDEWRTSFKSFLACVGRRPSEEHEIDRYPNNDGDYEPGNCRWATRKEQARNRRSNVNITWRGRTQCQAAWAEELGISRQALRARVKKWGIEKALATRERTDVRR